jgi:serine/threonine protein phosphatase PrpC
MKFKISDLASLNKKGKRNYNEDYLYPAIANVTPDLIINKSNNEKGLLLMVCDGVGGSVAGDQASRKVCELFPKVVQKKYESYSETEIADMSEKQHQKLLSEVLEEVESQIDEFLLEAPQFRGMATTLTFLYIVQDKAIVGWVGDSRVYRFRNTSAKEEQVKQTEDHSLVVQLWKGGRIQKHEMRNHPRSNVILQAISGSHNPAKIDVSVWDVKEKDLFLLCTDGILEGFDTYEALEDEVLSSLREGNKLEVLKDIIDKKCDEKAKDNYTMHLAQVSIDDTGRIVPGFIPDDKRKGKKFLSPKWKKLLTKIGIGILFVAILSMVGYIIYDSMPSPKKGDEKDCVQEYKDNIKEKKSDKEKLQYVIQRSEELIKNPCKTLDIQINKDLELYGPNVEKLQEVNLDKLDGLDANKPSYKSDSINLRTELSELQKLIEQYLNVRKTSNENTNNDKHNTNTTGRVLIKSSSKIELYKNMDDTNSTILSYTYIYKDSTINKDKRTKTRKGVFQSVELVAFDMIATKKKGENIWALRSFNINSEKWEKGKEAYKLIESTHKCPNYATITTKKDEKSITKYINSKGDIKTEKPTSAECGN